MRIEKVDADLARGGDATAGHQLVMVRVITASASGAR
jgi:hypothetical protein